jgi:hypothetical protein
VPAGLGVVVLGFGHGIGVHLALHDGHDELVRATQVVGRQAGGHEDDLEA